MCVIRPIVIAVSSRTCRLQSIVIARSGMMISDSG
jgi:hypothetical protein